MPDLILYGEGSCCRIHIDTQEVVELVLHKNNSHLQTNCVWSWIENHWGVTTLHFQPNFLILHPCQGFCVLLRAGAWVGFLFFVFWFLCVVKSGSLGWLGTTDSLGPPRADTRTLIVLSTSLPKTLHTTVLLSSLVLKTDHCATILSHHWLHWSTDHCMG